MEKEKQLSALRERFEDWFRERHPGAVPSFLNRTSKSGAYDLNWVNLAWLAWKEASALAVPQSERCSVCDAPKEVSDDGEHVCGLTAPEAYSLGWRRGNNAVAAAAPKPADSGQEQTHFCQNTKQIELTSLSACSCVGPDAPKPAPACEAPPAPSKLPQSFNAQDWAKEFTIIAASKGIVVDEEWMVTWFANALMAGYDERGRALAASVPPTEKK